MFNIQYWNSAKAEWRSTGHSATSREEAQLLIKATDKACERTVRFRIMPA